MTFLAAPLLFGLALAGLPVLIHLLNRRRFQVVDWAPMRYLKLTIRSNKRRMQWEQLLLLLLRTLLVVLLVLAIARPLLGKTGLGGWLARRGRTSRVIVVDTAMNTGYRAGGRSALDRAKAAAAEVLANTGSQDAVTVLTTAPGAAPLAREAGPEAAGRLAGAVRDLKPTDAACDWAATFKAVDDCLSTATFPDRQVVLITDLRRSGWRTGGAAITQLADHWAATRVEARVVDVGSRDTADVSLARFAQDDPLALPDAPVKLSAAVRNGTAAAVVGATATLTVDGDRRPVLLPPLPPGATTDVPLAVTLDRPGPHALSLALPGDALAGDALPGDALPGDNVRHLGVDVRDRLDLTIVDGHVGAGPFESAGDFVQVAATVGRAAWQVKRISADDAAAAARLPPADVTVLADVASLPPVAVADLATRVRQGMGLIVFAGEAVDPAFYNDQLYKVGLLPCRVDRRSTGRSAGSSSNSWPTRPPPRSPASRPPPSTACRPAGCSPSTCPPGPTTRSASWPGGTTPRVTRHWSSAASAGAGCCWSRPRPTASGPTGRPTRRTCCSSAPPRSPWPAPTPATPTPSPAARSSSVPTAPSPTPASPRRTTPPPQPVATVNGVLRSAPAVTAGVYTFALDRRRRRHAVAAGLGQLRCRRRRFGADRRTATGAADGRPSNRRSSGSSRASWPPTAPATNCGGRWPRRCSACSWSRPSSPPGWAGRGNVRPPSPGTPGEGWGEGDFDCRKPSDANRPPHPRPPARACPIDAVRGRTSRGETVAVPPRPPSGRVQVPPAAADATVRRRPLLRRPAARHRTGRRLPCGCCEVRRAANRAT